MMQFREQFNYHVWMSLSRLIEKRYQRYIGFSPTLDSLDLDKDYVVNRNGDLILPIRTATFFYGSVTVRKGGSLESHDIKAIHSMIESIGLVLLDVNAPYSKIEEFEAAYEDNKKQIVNIVGENLELAQKVAYQIQDIIGSWSILPWSDAGMANWSSEEMASLSDICLYVRDLLELSSLERQQLVTLARLPNSMRPHLLIRTPKPLVDYVQEQKLEVDIVELLSNLTLFLDQIPQDTSQLAETLKMLLNNYDSKNLIEGNKFN